MRELNNYLIPAIQAAQTLESSNGIAEEYNGYIASFGASIKQSGIPITVAMFMRGDRDAQDKRKLLQAIWKIVREVNPSMQLDIDMFSYYKSNHPGDALINLQVEYAAVALKLAIRTFPKIKKDRV